MTRLRGWAFVSALFLIAYGQVAGGLAAAGRDGQPSGRQLRFTANDLYGHINGGAELFLEFGFTELLVQSYQVGEAVIAAESYLMDSPVAALGIYLLKCGDESPVEDLPFRNTANPYQLTAVAGATFLQVNSFSGEETLLPAMTAIAGRELTTGEAVEREEAPPAMIESLPIWDYLPVADLVPGSELLIRGPFALQPIYTLGEGDILQLGGRIFGLVADYRDGAEATHTRIIVPYPDPERAQRAYHHLVKHLDPYLEILSSSSPGLVFKDYQGKYGSIQLTGAVLEVRVHLLSPPR